MSLNMLLESLRCRSSGHEEFTSFAHLQPCAIPGLLLLPLNQRFVYLYIYSLRSLPTLYLIRLVVVVANLRLVQFIYPYFVHLTQTFDHFKWLLFHFRVPPSRCQQIKVFLLLHRWNDHD